MTEPEVKAEPATAPELPQAEVEAQTVPAETPQETSPLTLDKVNELIEAARSQDRTEMESIRKELESAYKTLRRGEAKSDTAQKRIDRLEQELFDVSLRGLDENQQEIAKLKRQNQQAAPTVDQNAELAAFNGYARTVLEEEGISEKDPILAEWFSKYADGWTSQADLRVALTRSVAKVHAEAAKKARAESADKEKKAREEERAKLRNEKRQADGPVDKGTPASASSSKNFLTMPQEEWDAFNKTRRR